MQSTILARTAAGAERAARLVVGDATSIVDEELSEKSRDLVLSSEPDLLIVECDTDDHAWLVEALSLARQTVRPGTEVRLIVESAEVDQRLEETITNAFAGWAISGATVNGDIIALHATPLSEAVEAGVTRESLQGALQLSAMLRMVADPSAQSLPEFEYRSSLAMSHLTQVPRLQAEVEQLRRELTHAKQAERQLEERLRSSEKPDVERAEPDPGEGSQAESKPRRAGPLGRPAKLALIAGAAALWVVLAWLVADQMNGATSGFLTLLVLGTFVALLYDMRRRFVTLHRATRRNAALLDRIRRHERSLERGVKRLAQDGGKTADLLTSLTNTVITESGSVKALTEEVEARARDAETSVKALTEEVEARARDAETSVKASVVEHSAEVMRAVQESQDKVAKRLDGVSNSVNTHSSQLLGTLPSKGDVARMVRAELLITYHQLESNLRLRDVVDVTGLTPQLRGWAASPDVIAFLVDEMLRIRPRLMVECGSGASTVWLAMASRSMGLDLRVIALEHEESYADETSRFLVECGVDDVAEVRLAPLEDANLDGHESPWYSRSALEGLEDIGLVFVDGPPRAVGPRSRYPALPVLRSRLAPNATVVLDDLIRDEEKETVALWAEEFPEMDVTELSFEKGAAVLRLRGDTSDPPTRT